MAGHFETVSPLIAIKTYSLGATFSILPDVRKTMRPFGALVAAR